LAAPVIRATVARSMLGKIKPYAALVLVAGLVGVAVWWFRSSGANALERVFAWAQTFIEAHAVGGMIVFALLSALSAMAAFLSSALLVPVATAAWGKLWTAALLWIGWIVGGLAAYGIGRALGRSVVKRLIPEKLEAYEKKITRHTRWWMLLLFQLGVPSAVPGYVTGMVRYRFVGYLSALALAEIPYAAGAVYLGESFIERNTPVFLGIAAASVLFVVVTCTSCAGACAGRNGEALARSRRAAGRGSA
jgi:uncharacterized membrane protein YdjX (TVP38/TMEM64 family)